MSIIPNDWVQMGGDAQGRRHPTEVLSGPFIQRKRKKKRKLSLMFVVCCLFAPAFT